MVTWPICQSIKFMEDCDSSFALSNSQKKNVSDGCSTLPPSVFHTCGGLYTLSTVITLYQFCKPYIGFWVQFKMWILTYKGFYVLGLKSSAGYLLQSDFVCFFFFKRGAQSIQDLKKLPNLSLEGTEKIIYCLLLSSEINLKLCLCAVVWILKIFLFPYRTYTAKLRTVLLECLSKCFPAWRRRMKKMLL